MLYSDYIAPPSFCPPPSSINPLQIHAIWFCNSFSLTKVICVTFILDYLLESAGVITGYLTKDKDSPSL